MRSANGRSGRGKSLGVGVVGCGRAAIGLHLPALARIPELSVVALCDLDPERLARSPAEPSSRYRDYRDLVADPRVEIVLVASPPGNHAEMVISALEAGKHVYVEKPLALDLESVDRIMAASAGAPGQAVVVGFNLRSHRLLRQASERIRAGALGRILALRGVLIGGLADRPAWQRSAAEGGGAVLELGTHHFDLWHHLLGGGAEGVEAREIAGGAPGTRAQVTARVDGAIATALLALDGVPTHTLEVVGDRGTLRFSFHRGDSLEIHPAGRLSTTLGWVRGLPEMVSSARRGGDYLDSYRRHWLRFVEHLQGAEAPATLLDGRRALGVALGALGHPETRLAS